MKSPNRVVILVASTLLCAGVAARPGDPAPPAVAPDPLQGPSVGDSAGAGPTIVERSFDGTLKRLDVRPEEAAVRKLDLSADEKAKVDQVLAERSKAMDQVVREHIDLLVRVQSAKASGDQAQIKAATQELKDALRPLVGKGPLGEQLSQVLSKEHADKLQQMVKNYYRALIAEGMRQRPKGDPMPDAEDEMAPTPESAQRRATVARITQDIYGQEIRRSYERIAADAHARLEDLVKALDLTPEQAEKVRAIATEAAQKNKLNPSPAQKVELFSKIAKELTPEQRKKLVELVGEKR